MARKTTEDINALIESRGLRMIGDYLSFDKHAKALFRCDNGHEWISAVGNVTRGSGCPHCYGNVTLTKEIVNERLLKGGRGIQLVGEYLSALKKTLFRCDDGHEWQSTPANIMVGNGCPHCSKIRITTEYVNAQLKSRGIQLMGESLGSDTKVLFKCSNGHEFMNTPSALLRGFGCAQCSDTKLTAEEVNNKIRHRNIKLIGEYVNANTKALFRCEDGHEWMATPGNVLHRYSTCPTCSYGFNPSKPAHGYLIQFEEGFLKFGITNSLEQRLMQHRMNGKYTVIATKAFSVGKDALLWENTIKKTHGGYYVTKERCPDGHTETLSLDLLNTIKLTLT